MQQPAKPKYVNQLFQIPIRSGDQEKVDEEPLLILLCLEWVKQIQRSLHV